MYLFNNNFLDSTTIIESEGLLLKKTYYLLIFE